MDTQVSLHKQGYGPDLNKYINKRVKVRLNGKRTVTGKVVGNDLYMNIVLDNAIDVTDPNKEIDIGKAVIRGNTIVLWEIQDRVI